MKYLVTGATGFIGREIVKQLRAQDHEVVAIARRPDTAKDLAALRVRLVKGDVTDKESMREPMRGVDGVFHVAGWYKIGTKDRTPGVAVNVEGTRNVLDLMRELGIPKGVYTSTIAVNSDTHGRLVDETHRFEGRHLSEYDRTKALAHRVAEECIRGGLPLVIVQPGLVYGPGDTGPTHAFLADYLKRKLPLVPLQTAFSWAHVGDVAQGHLLAMERGRVGESYFLAGPPHTLLDALRQAEEITGISPPSFAAPPWMLKVLSGLMGVVERVVSVPETHSSEYLRVTAGATYIGDNAKARRELGWIPRSLGDGFEETLRVEMDALGIRPGRG